jgi:hypothetical protein
MSLLIIASTAPAHNPAGKPDPMNTALEKVSGAHKHDENHHDEPKP